MYPKMLVVQTRVVMDNEKKQMDSKDTQILPKDLHSQIKTPKTVIIGSKKNTLRILCIANMHCQAALPKAVFFSFVNYLVSVPLSEF